jgi:hypothetical protein
LLPAEDELAVITFVLARARAIKQVLIRHFVVARAPGMRENGIGRNVVTLELDKAEVTGIMELKKTRREVTVALRERWESTCEC